MRRSNELDCDKPINCDNEHDRVNARERREREQVDIDELIDMIDDLKQKGEEKVKVPVVSCRPSNVPHVTTGSRMSNVKTNHS